MEKFKYPDDWSHQVHEIKSDLTVVRANLVSEIDALSWVEKFGSLNQTSWVTSKLYGSSKTTNRYIFHKRWLCQHTSRNKKPNSKRGTGCPLSLDILIKIITTHTRHSDKFLRLKPALQAVIKIGGAHNHPTDTPEALRSLRVSAETRSRYESYFKDGLCVAGAMRAHAAKLRELGTSEKDLANSSINPTANMVESLFYTYNSQPPEHHSDILEKLKEQQSYYEKHGVTMCTTGNSALWSVLVVTPVMKKAQELSPAAEVVFIDSTISLESNMMITTVVVAATKAGAIPLAVLIHNTQDSRGYSQAFQLLKQSCPTCFNGKDAPEFFMSDDYTPEKKALRAIFPWAKQLLSHLHVRQSEWRWLVANTSVEHRTTLMNLFHAIMCSTSEDELSKNVEKAVQRGKDYPDYTNRINNYLKRKTEWVALYRVKELNTKSHNTRSFAEVYIRVIKDILLHRSKANDVVSLVKFIVDQLDNCFETTIRNLAFSPEAKNVKICIDGMNVKDVMKIDSSRFTVPSVNTINVTYEVNTWLGLCSCLAGQEGAFCKHQSFIHKTYNIPLPNLPVINSADNDMITVEEENSKLDFYQTFGYLLDSFPSDFAIPSVSSQPSPASSIDDMSVCDESDPAIDEEERMKFIAEAENVERSIYLIRMRFIPTDVTLKWLAVRKKELACLNSFKTREEYIANVIDSYKSDVMQNRHKGKSKNHRNSKGRRKVQNMATIKSPKH